MAEKTNHTILAGAAFFSLLFLAFAVCASAEDASAPAVVRKTTLDNLMAAYNGESNARVRYLAFAQKADAEGYGQAASLFRAAARAEQIHLRHHAELIKQLGGIPAAEIEKVDVGITKGNLESAVKGETSEKDTMCPEFKAQAEKDGPRRGRGCL